jgi:hypothetical protein
VSRRWGARVTSHGHLVSLENQVLRVGVDARRGAEIVECLFKPRDVDFAARLPLGPRLAHSPDPQMAFIAGYTGGWQEVFPNGGAPSTHRGARFGQHDEVWQLPWDWQVVSDTDREVGVRFSTLTRLVPFSLHKELRLCSGAARLEISETIENLSQVGLEAMWGQHLTFGPPFLREGCRVELDGEIEALPHPEPIDPAGRRLASERGRWPRLAAAGGGEVDLSRIPPRGTLSDIVYLAGFSEGRYQIRDPEGFGLRVEWDAGLLPYLWFWQEFGAGRDYPWYGRLYTVGLEPFSSYPTSGLAEAVANGSALHFEPGGRKSLKMSLEVIDG